MAKMKKNVSPAADFSRRMMNGREGRPIFFFDATGAILTKGAVAIHGTRMKTLSFAGLLIVMALAALPARAEGLTFAVVAPKEGPLAILGRQVFDGARFAAEALGDRVVEIGEACDGTDGEAIPRAILAADATAALGFLCTEGLSAALPALAEASVPAVTLSVRSGILMEDALKRNWPLFRLAPGPDAEADKAAEVIIRDWKSLPFALIDDGTIHARELVEAVRLKLEEVGMKPTFVDTFRPAQEQQITLVRRLGRTGVERVFVGGDRTDTAIIARDAKAEGLSLGLLGGETLMGADQTLAMTDGVQAVALPDYETLPDAAAAAAAMKEKGIVAEGYVLPAHAAVTLLATAAAREGTPLAESLKGGSFTTAIGTIGFTADHELRENPYRLLEWRGGAFVPVDAPPAGE